jgi:hypothetical protein
MKRVIEIVIHNVVGLLRSYSAPLYIKDCLENNRRNTVNDLLEESHCYQHK